MPLPALRSTYRYLLAVALSEGPRQITSSQRWDREVIVQLWPRVGMTWQDFGVALTALEQFAMTVGFDGFRFDVMAYGRAVGLGVVFARKAEATTKFELL